MGSITVNGRRIDVPSGRFINIINGDIFVNGQRCTENGDLKQIDIVIEGDFDLLQVGSCDRIDVKGDVHGDISAGGNVNCGNVTGSITAGGSVTHK